MKVSLIMKPFVMRCSLFVCATLLLGFLLTACGGMMGNTSAPAATKVPVPSPTPSPIPSPTPSPTPISKFKALHADGYRIDYPVDWSATTSSGLFVLPDKNHPGDQLAEFTGETLDTTLSIDVVQTTSALSLQALVSLQGTTNTYLQHFQKKQVPATIIINGVQWDQSAATETYSKTGINSTIYVIATTFPGNPDKGVQILYSAPTSEFDTTNTNDFQPMLHSFKFV